MSRGGRRAGKESASRISWIIHFGVIPNGIFVCHKCDNGPWCVRPDHLFLGTPSDNIQDMLNKGRNLRQIESAKANWGERSVHSRLSLDDVLSIRKDYPSLTLDELALRHNVGKSQIFRVVHRISWKYC